MPTLVVLILAALDARAEPGSARYRIEVDTYQWLFRRAPLPGPAGALVRSETHAPLYEYVLLCADGLDAPWAADSVDVELAAWGSVDPGETAAGRHIDGDVHVLSARQRFGPAYVKLGRQLRAGGAARLVRFDGLSAGARAPFGGAVDLYGGFTALPRWDRRPGYHLFGSPADAPVREAVRGEYDFHEMQREREWLAGGKIALRESELGELGASFHEEHGSGGLHRRELGLDLHAQPVRALGVAAQGIVDVDSGGIADARLLADAALGGGFVMTAEALHATPALLLSRQSVLGVFSIDSYDELGGSLGWRERGLPSVTLAAYVLRLAEGNVGGRGSLEAHYSPPALEALTLALRYGRLSEAESGYHHGRVALALTPLARLRLTGELHAYLYDQPIAGVGTSGLALATAGYRFDDRMSLLVGGSAARSPLAALDAQAFARLSVGLDGGAW
jgi:hypothetical protein